MGKRYLNCTASDILKMDSAQLIDAIAGSEGRLLVCETIGAVRPMLGDVTNAEFACAMGADLLILNLFDVNKPEVQGLPETAPEDVVPGCGDQSGTPGGGCGELRGDERGMASDFRAGGDCGECPQSH